MDEPEEMTSRGEEQEPRAGSSDRPRSPWTGRGWVISYPQRPTRLSAGLHSTRFTHEHGHEGARHSPVGFHTWMPDGLEKQWNLGRVADAGRRSREPLTVLLALGLYCLFRLGLLRLCLGRLRALSHAAGYDLGDAPHA